MRRDLKQRSGARHAALILGALRRVGRPMSAYDLISELRGRAELAPQTVYRALNRLIADGTAHKIQSLNAFIARTRAEPYEMPAFAVCDACGFVSEFDAPQLNASLQSWAHRAGFDLRSTTLELHGTCSACRTAGDAGASRAPAQSARDWRLS